MMPKSDLLTDTCYKRVNLINIEMYFIVFYVLFVRMQGLTHGLILSYNGRIKGLQIIDKVVRKLLIIC